MQKKELIEAVATECNLTHREVKEIIDTTLDIIINEIENGNEITLFGFGSFEPKTNSARMGINPQTKEPLQIKESKSVKFKVAKSFKDNLNK